ncbi:MAG: radical SAM protein [Syntrophaceae bacterium]|nr:radical SAM protein [Syntrophaceae bacterium]
MCNRECKMIPLDAHNRQLTFFISCSGCARSGMNAEKVRILMERNNLKMVDSPDFADYILMLTCGLPTAMPYVLLEIQVYKELKGELIVCGCMPAMEPEKLEEVFNGKTVITKELAKIDELFPDFRYKFKDAEDPNICFKNGHYHPYIKSVHDSIKNLLQKALKEPIKASKQLIWKVLEHEIRMPILNRTGLPRLITVDPDKYSIRISQGCKGNCSYCAIRFAIGRLKSKDPDQVIHEVQEAISKGIFSISIVSDDSGTYGSDIGTNIISLLQRILNVDKRVQIEYLQDLHPHHLIRFKDDLIELFKTGRIKSLQSAFQSGSERILHLMNRPMDIGAFKETINELKKAFSSLKIGTQVIVGFPSETEEDFSETVKVLEDCRFDQVDIFRYYEYKLCQSSSIFPKVPKEIMEKRQRLLLDKRPPTLIVFSRINMKRILHQIGFRLKLWKEPVYY